MWRCEPGLDSKRTPVADQLTAPWSELVDDVLSADFRDWLTDGTGVDVRSVRSTVGLYIFGDGDYTTVDTGKVSKALSFGLYLNETWDPAHGGAFQVFTHKAPDAEPVREIVPIGGRCVTMTPTEHTWHRIQRVDTGGAVSRLLLMVEFWRD
ncbi:2OG-Fe(II) oxygenase [Actinokineospora soli]|uniref:2OG-Fe(II) oxygenase n=1 Tax=Actinokineospora soli TaxID=1048753 RepID=A0ABW2TRB8_9PSEU